nr:MetaGeneMark_Unknown Function [uncultured bacterium]
MTKSIYAAYFTGKTGNSMGMFVIGDGLITGADVTGVNYDGRYDAFGKTLRGVVDFVLPPSFPTDFRLERREGDRDPHFSSN